MTPQRKRPALRAFKGLAGSPTASVVKIKAKRGRPRKWKCDADRKRFERGEKRQTQFSGRLKTDLPSETDGRYMADAPHGRGLLITGGYSPTKIEIVSDAAYQAESGRTCRAKGSGPADGSPIGQDGATIGATRWQETDSTFHDRHPIPDNYVATPSKPHTIKKLFCPVHSGKAPYVDRAGPQPVPVVSVLATNKLACGCVVWTFGLACGCRCTRNVRTTCTQKHPLGINGRGVAR